MPAGAYTLDKAHARLIFKVNHLGFLNYTARFRSVDAELQFDPQNLAASKLVAIVDVRSLETDFPKTPELDFNETLLGKEWLDAATYPTMTYRSTTIEPTGPKTMRVIGNLILRGVTRPVTLEVTYNGGYAGHPMDPYARIGFSAQGTLNGQ